MEEIPQEDKEEVAVIPNESGVGQKRDSRYDERDRNRIVSSVMTWPSHLIFAIFTIYVIYLCIQNYSLFALHPAFMTIGSIFLMAEAVMIMSPDSICGSKLGHEGRVRLHWILQAGAAGFIFAGFLTIVILKNMNNKKHFQSWHAIIGLVSFICVGITSSGGVITLYSLRLKKFIKPGKMKLLHILAGIVTFATGVLSEVFGLYTHWFPKMSSPTAQVICTVFIALGTIFALEGALKSAYSRFKALYQSI